MSKLTRRFNLSAVLGAALLIGLTACGDDGSASGDSGGSGSGGMSVTIQEPADGATIDFPFMLKVDSTEKLGPTESGSKHVHLYFDGDDSKYEVIEATEMEITDKSPAAEGLEPGEHELNISLRNADHSPAGFDTKVMVQVGGEGGGDGDGSGGGGGDGY